VDGIGSLHYPFEVFTLSSVETLGSSTKRLG